MRICLFLFASLAVLSGCNSVTAYTKIDSDGSFSRTVRYATRTPGTPSVASFESSFDLPKVHPGVSFRLGKDDKGQVLTTSRKIKAGHPVPADITLLGTDRKPQVQCSVSVQKLANGDVSYDETIHWVGEKPNLSGEGSPEIGHVLEQVLPERLRAKADDAKVTFAVMKPLSQIVYGPPYPYALDLASNPDLIDLDVDESLESRIAEAIKQIFPDMTSDETREVILNIQKLDRATLSKVIAERSMGKKGQTPSMGSDALMEDEDSLLFVVKPPGAVVESNGLPTRDGHVYWCLYKDSLPFADAVLHLVAHSGDSK